MYWGAISVTERMSTFVALIFLLLCVKCDKIKVIEEVSAMLDEKVRLTTLTSAGG